MKGPTNTGMRRRRKAMIAKKTNRRDGPDMRLRPPPKPERSMFDQSMLPQSLPPSPPRPRSRIDLRIGVVGFGRSPGPAWLVPTLVANLAERGKIFDFDQVLVSTCGAFHPDKVIEGRDGNVRTNEVHSIRIPLELLIVEVPGCRPEAIERSVIRIEGEVQTSLQSSSVKTERDRLAHAPKRCSYLRQGR